MGPIDCTETSVTDYHPTLLNIWEERRPQLHRGWSLESLTTCSDTRYDGLYSNYYRREYSARSLFNDTIPRFIKEESSINSSSDASAGFNISNTNRNEEFTGKNWSDMNVRYRSRNITYWMYNFVCGFLDWRNFIIWLSVSYLRFSLAVFWNVDAVIVSLLLWVRTCLRQTFSHFLQGKIRQYSPTYTSVFQVGFDHKPRVALLESMQEIIFLGVDRRTPLTCTLRNRVWMWWMYSCVPRYKECHLGRTAVLSGRSVPTLRTTVSLPYQWRWISLLCFCLNGEGKGILWHTGANLPDHMVSHPIIQ